MEKLIFSLFLALPLIFTEAHVPGGGFTKLFVFGDSYVDTGNGGRQATSWKKPYGIIFPGKPTGRYSDGRVFTDYIASWMGIRSPIPYRWRKMGKKVEGHGMNFAYGGTGVFDTLVKAPNMTTQINLFQQVLEEKLYTKRDLKSSIALVSLAGNDYAAYFAGNGTIQSLPAFTTSLIRQLSLNMKHIHGMGVRKVAIMAIQPLGCLPQVSALTSYPNCSVTGNSISKFHNQILEKSVQKLNKETKDSVYIKVDIYSAFTAAMKSQEHHPGTSKFKDPLKQCCRGVNSAYSCGDVDKNGAYKYVVCKKPNSAFFWDSVHPTQAGWDAVFSALKSSLHILLG